MQNNFSDCLAFAVIRNALGQEIDLVDRAVIVREEEYEGFCISVPTDLAYTKSAIGVCNE